MEPRARLGLIVVPGYWGITIMTNRDDMRASYVPAIDWFELFMWALLITMSSVLAGMNSAKPV